MGFVVGGASVLVVAESDATVVSTHSSVDIIASVVDEATVELGFSQKVTGGVLLVLS